MLEIDNIIQGATNKLLSDLGYSNIDIEVLAAKRLAICNNCILLSIDKNSCDKNKSVEVQVYGNKYNIIKGCGCNLQLKSRSNSKCPLSKW